MSWRLAGDGAPIRVSAHRTHRRAYPSHSWQHLRAHHLVAAAATLTSNAAVGVPGATHFRLDGSAAIHEQHLAGCDAQDQGLQVMVLHPHEPRRAKHSSTEALWQQPVASHAEANQQACIDMPRRATPWHGTAHDMQQQQQQQQTQQHPPPSFAQPHDHHLALPTSTQPLRHHRQQWPKQHTQPQSKQRKQPAYAAAVTAETQQCIHVIQSSTSLSTLRTACEDIASNHPRAARQPGLFLAVSAHLQSLLRDHVTHMGDMRAMLAAGMATPHNEPSAPVTPAHPQPSHHKQVALKQGKAEREHVRIISSLLCTWVVQGCAIQPSQPQAGTATHHHHTTTAQQPRLLPHQAVTILHALARAVRVAGGSCASTSTVQALLPALTSLLPVPTTSLAPSPGSPTPASPMQDNIHRPGKARQPAPLQAAQLVTAAWSLAVLGSHHLCPNNLPASPPYTPTTSPPHTTRSTHTARTGTPQAGMSHPEAMHWLYRSTAPVLPDLSSTQMARLMWALATLILPHPNLQPTQDCPATPTPTITNQLLPPPAWWHQLESAMLAPSPPRSSHDSHGGDNHYNRRSSHRVPPYTETDISRYPIQHTSTTNANHYASRSIQTMAYKPRMLDQYGPTELGLCCWAASHLTITSSDTTRSNNNTLDMNTTGYGPASPLQSTQQPSESSTHGEQCSNGQVLNATRQGTLLHPSRTWVRVLMSGLWNHVRPNRQNHLDHAAMHAASVAPMGLAAFVRGMAQLGHTVPEPLLSHLVSAASRPTRKHGVRTSLAHSSLHADQHQHQHPSPQHTHTSPTLTLTVPNTPRQHSTMSVSSPASLPPMSSPSIQVPVTSNTNNCATLARPTPAIKPLPGANGVINGVTNGVINGHQPSELTAPHATPPPHWAAQPPTPPAMQPEPSFTVSQVIAQLPDGTTVLPISQLVQVLGHCYDMGVQLPDDTLAIWEASLLVALPQCTPSQLERLASQLARLGLRQPSRSLVQSWLRALGTCHGQMRPDQEVAVLQVLVTWQVWPGCDWLCSLLTNTRALTERVTQRRSKGKAQGVVASGLLKELMAMRAKFGDPAQVAVEGERLQVLLRQLEGEGMKGKRRTVVKHRSSSDSSGREGGREGGRLSSGDD